MRDRIVMIVKRIHGVTLYTRVLEVTRQVWRTLIYEGVGYQTMRYVQMKRERGNMNGSGVVSFHFVFVNVM
jgi:hypothetical protein